MPRIYDGDSNPVDFCRKCFPSLSVAQRKYGSGEGPDERGNCFTYDTESHPPYSDTDYTCETCGKPLTDADNHGATR